MLASQSDVFDIASGTVTVLTVRESNTLQRTFYFKNLTASELSVSIESSLDGGGTWSVIDTAFTVGAQGSATECVVKDVTSDGILRVRASGGGDDRDVYIAYTRILDAGTVGAVWCKPVL